MNKKLRFFKILFEGKSLHIGIRDDANADSTV